MLKYSASAAFRALVRFYQVGVSPALGPACRFEPSCSEYALAAVERFGFARGLWVAARRLGRCHPLGGAGFDPVPDPISGRISSRVCDGS